MTSYSGKKKKLLVVTTTFPRWKDDTDPPFVYELAKRLTDQFDVVVHTPMYVGAKRAELLHGMAVYRFRYFISRFECLAGGVAILPFLRQNRGYYLVLPFFLLAQLVSLFFLIRRECPDVIHAHWIIPTGLFAVLSCGSSPVVVTGHGADIFGLKGRLFGFLKKKVLQRCRALTVVSMALQDEIAPLASAALSTHIIPMGVDEQRFISCRKGKDEDLAIHKLLYVGRLTEKKGVHILLEAFAKVWRQRKDLFLTIVGGGDWQEKLQAQAAALGLQDAVTFVGAVPNESIAKYYADSDIFIGPSVQTKYGDTEGFGLTFIEASFSGCFLIGSKVGGIPDIIEDGVSGLLVEPGNAERLAEKILWAVEHPKEVQKMTSAAYSVHIKSYSWQVITTRYREILSEQ